MYKYNEHYIYEEICTKLKTVNINVCVYIYVYICIFILNVYVNA